MKVEHHSLPRNKTKICIVCKKPYPIKLSKNHRRKSFYRPKNSLTCSRKCAREYLNNRLKLYKK
jgi:hypothetical protein